jgi:hypothetical protein
MTRFRLRSRPAAYIAVAIAAVVAVIGAPAAWAVFSATGITSSANDTAGVLPTPTISATSSSGTVTLTLGSTGGTATPLSYTISASPSTGTGTGGTCASASWPPPATCTYTGVASGSYTYTLTAAYNSWSKAATSTPVTVSAGGQFVGIGAPVTVTSSTNNVTVNYPAGTVAGDLLIVVVVNGANQNSTAPTGWTQIAAPSSNSGLSCSNAQFELQAFWNVAASGQTSVTMSSIHTSSGDATAWVVAYSGLTSPVTQNGTAVSGIVTGSPVTMTPATFTTTATNATVISMAATCAAKTETLSTANGFTVNTATTVAPTGGQGGGLGVASESVATAGAVTSPTWSQGTGSASWAYITTAFT